MKWTTILLPLLLAFTSQPAPASEAPAVPRLDRLPSGATVVFLGDSITWQNGFPAAIEQVSRALWPDKSLRFINRGVRGDTASGALARLERDVFPLEPAWVIVMLGMNDSGYRGVNRNLVSFYLDNMSKLVDALRHKTRARLLLLTPTCMDPSEYAGARNNPMLAQMADGLGRLGPGLRIPVIDVHTPFCQAIDRGRSLAPPVELMADAIHPNLAGHWLIADRLLARLVPDAKAPEPVRLRVKAGKPDHLDLTNARHVFLPDNARAVLRLSPTLDRLRSRPLVVSGLSGPVELLADGQSLGVFSPEHLAAGLDLNGLSRSPWMRRAAALRALLWQRWQMTYALWDPEEAGWHKALAAVRPGTANPIRATSRDQLRQRLLKVEHRIQKLQAEHPAYRIHWRPVPGR